MAQNFNSHAHVERDHHIFLGDSEPLHFNSHAHVERDIGIGINAAIINISTHTLTWSVTFAVYMTMEHIFYFNSHAHVERDLLYI